MDCLLIRQQFMLRVPVHSLIVYLNTAHEELDHHVITVSITSYNFNFSRVTISPHPFLYAGNE